jgi:hypothetical protein
MLPNVPEMAAAQIIDNANFGGTARKKVIGERRADERSSSCDKHSLSRPKGLRWSHLRYSSSNYFAAMR